jgi:hypothetical protein
VKIYTWNGATSTTLPGKLTLPGGDTISPVREDTFLAYGGIIEEDGEPTPEEEFEKACAYFRGVCSEISEFIGEPDFRGGFDEIPEFEASPKVAREPLEALMLSAKLNWANEQCVMRGAKIGLGQPDWWYKCWETSETTE